MELDAIAEERGGGGEWPGDEEEEEAGMELGGDEGGSSSEDEEDQPKPKSILRLRPAAAQMDYEENGFSAEQPKPPAKQQRNESYAKHVLLRWSAGLKGCHVRQPRPERIEGFAGLCRRSAVYSAGLCQRSAVSDFLTTYYPLCFLAQHCFQLPNRPQ